MFAESVMGARFSAFQLLDTLSHVKKAEEKLSYHVCKHCGNDCNNDIKSIKSSQIQSV